ncbi:HAD family phosphatase [Mucilaginibacter sp. L3T2-6]|uniref:HAD family hydrolase n=1 Tax=Mucilaginibacter sp. L3T2-6 TaxID=3062491 RepID=UPI002676D28A|nr:HAD family phosphatase [Mucilaginibacter sp. L3T2-6]MDO3644475.1 HAD family phosphatase [Mucilaginibacter sp. L3T2-6]MDV6216927.1 HAD family phosphatase [Mucilaginibacter sp. L3T2-6]
MEATKQGLTLNPSAKEKDLKNNAAQVSPAGGDLNRVQSHVQFAAIFDMDGTLIDNTPYHFKSWQALFKKYGRGQLTRQTYYTEISGVPVMETIRRLFGSDHDEAGLRALLNEKEEYYRQAYAPFVAPVNGLENFLTELKDAGVKMAMATSATIQDINFILDRIPIRNNFEVIINSTMVSKPKPDPQIFLKASGRLGRKPADCVVFEDSLAGIRAANSAGMKVAGITTGHTADELHPVDLVITDYTDLTVQKLATLFKEHQK